MNVGQPDVDDGALESRAPQVANSLGSVGRRLDAVALLLEQRAKTDPAMRLVLHHEDGRSSHPGTRCRTLHRTHHPRSEQPECQAGETRLGRGEPPNCKEIKTVAWRPGSAGRCNGYTGPCRPYMPMDKDWWEN